MSTGTRGRSETGAEPTVPASAVNQIQKELKEKTDQANSLQKKVSELTKQLVQSAQNVRSVEWQKRDDLVLSRLQEIMSRASDSKTSTSGEDCVDGNTGNARQDKSKSFTQELLSMVITQSDEIRQLRRSLEHQQQLTLKLAEKLSAAASTSSRTVNPLPIETLSQPIACSDDADGVSSQRTIVLIGDKEVDVSELHERLK